jgi:uncharacterized protein YciI
MASENQRITWPEMVELASTRNLLGMRLFVVSSKPTDGLGPVMHSIDEHLAYQTKLETEGVMFAAGPLATEDSAEWLGEGLFMYRADSIEEARAIAAADPMHQSGARVFTVREWMVNEGTFSLQVYFSAGIKPKVG